MLKRYWKRIYLPFSHKLMMSYVLFVMSPVVVIGYFAYQTSMQTMQDKVSGSIQGTLEQIRDNIGYKVDDMSRIAGRIYYDYKLQKLLRNEEEGWYTYETTRQYIIPTLENLLQYTKGSILITLYLKNENFPEMYDLQDETRDPLAKFKNYEVYHQRRIEQEIWWAELELDKKAVDGAVWKQVGLDERFMNLSLLRPMDDIQEWERIGFIRVTSKISELFESVDSSKIGKGSTLTVLDDSNRILFVSSDQTQSKESLADVAEREETDHLTLTESIAGMNWRVVATIPNSVINEPAKKVRNLTILVCLLSIVILTLISIGVSRYFSRRVMKIVSTLHAFQDGEFHKRIRFKGNDEFAQISAALNQMGHNIDDLIQQVYVTNLLKKEAELAALQAQINPHFLYNTLSSISGLAKLGETEKLHKMVKDLARFYRLSLNKGKTIIRVEQEIELVMAYVDIQKIKYGNRLVMSYDIDPLVREFDTVNFILQPFVENSLEHAWSGDQIHMSLTASLQQSQIIFGIRDDGVGMSEDTIEQIFSKGAYRLGYGIRNVDDRIKLQFGQEFGVNIHSRVGEGTEISILIPAYHERV